MAVVFLSPWFPESFFLTARKIKHEMGVSKNSGTPKSSILIGFSIINHPFWGSPIFGNTQMFIVFVGFLYKFLYGTWSTRGSLRDPLRM